METILSAIPAGKLHEKKQNNPPQSPQRSQRKFKIILCDLCGLCGFIKVYERVRFNRFVINDICICGNR
jgi:hypothetical protein